jgi:hypothetical protein
VLLLSRIRRGHSHEAQSTTQGLTSGSIAVRLPNQGIAVRERYVDYG